MFFLIHPERREEFIFFVILSEAKDRRIMNDYAVPSSGFALLRRTTSFLSCCEGEGFIFFVILSPRRRRGCRIYYILQSGEILHASHAG
jgi:hypothetical protein